MISNAESSNVKTTAIGVKASELVGVVKQIVGIKENIPVQRIHLFLRRHGNVRELEDYRTLDSYKINEGSYLHLSDTIIPQKQKIPVMVGSKKRKSDELAITGGGKKQRKQEEETKQRRKREERDAQDKEVEDWSISSRMYADEEIKKLEREKQMTAVKRKQAYDALAQKEKENAAEKKRKDDEIAKRKREQEIAAENVAELGRLRAEKSQLERKSQLWQAEKRELQQKVLQSAGNAVTAQATASKHVAEIDRLQAEKHQLEQKIQQFASAASVPTAAGNNTSSSSNGSSSRMISASTSVPSISTKTPQRLAAEQQFQHRNHLDTVKMTALCNELGLYSSDIDAVEVILPRMKEVNLLRLVQCLKEGPACLFKHAFFD